MAEPGDYSEIAEIMKEIVSLKAALDSARSARENAVVHENKLSTQLGNARIKLTSLLDGELDYASDKLRRRVDASRPKPC